jgi:hypothetical protein
LTSTGLADPISSHPGPFPDPAGDPPPAAVRPFFSPPASDVRALHPAVPLVLCHAKVR